MCDSDLDGATQAAVFVETTYDLAEHVTWGGRPHCVGAIVGSRLRIEWAMVVADGDAAVLVGFWISVPISPSGWAINNFVVRTMSLLPQNAEEALVLLRVLVDAEGHLLPTAEHVQGTDELAVLLGYIALNGPDLPDLLAAPDEDTDLPSLCPPSPVEMLLS